MTPPSKKTEDSPDSGKVLQLGRRSPAIAANEEKKNEALTTEALSRHMQSLFAFESAVRAQAATEAKISSLAAFRLPKKADESAPKAGLVVKGSAKPAAAAPENPGGKSAKKIKEETKKDAADAPLAEVQQFPGNTPPKSGRRRPT